MLLDVFLFFVVMFFFCDRLARLQAKKNVPYLFFERVLIVAFLSNFFVSFSMFNNGLIGSIEGNTLKACIFIFFLLPILAFNFQFNFYFKNRVRLFNGCI